MFNTLQRFGGAFGIAVATAVFSAHGHLGSVASVTAGYRPALTVAAVLSLIGAVIAVVIRRQPATRLAEDESRPQLELARA